MSTTTLDTTTVRRWKRYSQYRPSEAKWHSEVPFHWKVLRLKFLAGLNPSKSEVARLADGTEVSFLPMERVGEDGSLSLEFTRPLGEVRHGFTYFRNGDVLVAKITPCFENCKGAHATGLTNGIGFGTTELHVLRPRTPIDGRYLELVTRLRAFREQGEREMYGAAGQQRVPESFLSNYVAPLPPLLEQRAIATFLDRETARIDTLIGHKEGLIALLEEKRRAVISHALSCGFDSDVPRKDSGVPAVGAVPAHWEVRRNKFLFREIDQRSLAGDEDLLTVSHISGVTLRSEKPDVTMFLAESNEGYKVCQPGDLVINTMWAFMGAVGVSPQEGCVSPSYNVYRPRDPSSFVPTFLDLLYRVDAYKCEMLRFSKGIWHSRLRLYPDAFLNMLTVQPPRAEQVQILKYIESQTATGRAFFATLQDSIARLREYRTALISAAVTGQIDVRGEVTP